MAELPLTVQLVSVAVPLLNRPPPVVGGVAADGAVGQRERAASCSGRRRAWPALPPVIVSPEMDAVTPASTWNTRLRPAAADRHARRRARDRLRLGRVAQLELVPVRVIVCGVAKTCFSKVMVEIPEESKLAKAMASGRLKRPGPGKRESLVVFTIRLVKPGRCWSGRSETGDEPEAGRDDGVTADGVVGRGE